MIALSVYLIVDERLSQYRALGRLYCVVQEPSDLKDYVELDGRMKEW